jgi:hypothetical protein
MTTNGSKTRPPVWNAKCVHCAFKVEGLTLPDMRAAVSQHERENRATSAAHTGHASCAPASYP